MNDCTICGLRARPGPCPCEAAAEACGDPIPVMDVPSMEQAYPEVTDLEWEAIDTQMARDALSRKMDRCVCGHTRANHNYRGEGHCFGPCPCERFELAAQPAQEPEPLRLDDNDLRLAILALEGYERESRELLRSAERLRDSGHVGVGWVVARKCELERIVALDDRLRAEYRMLTGIEWCRERPESKLEQS